MFLSGIKSVNVIVTFFLELGVLIAWAYYGFESGPHIALKLLLGLGLPILAALVWSLFGAPRGIWHLVGIWRLLLQIVFFGSAVVALFLSGQPIWGIVYALVFIINTALIYGLGEPEWARSQAHRNI